MGGSSKVDYSGAEQGYSDAQKQIQQAIAQAQAQGRTDIVDYLQKAAGINQPYMQAGTDALSAWKNSVGIGDQGQKGVSDLTNKFQQSPGYQYALQQAQNATNRQAAASGMGQSGAEKLQLQSNAQGLADQDWNNWLNNYQSNLSSIAGRGQQSAMQQAGFTNQAGTSLANLGLQYTGMDVDSQEKAAQMKAEAEMAQQNQNAQSGNWLSSLGSVIGGVGSLFTGGLSGGLSSLFGGGSGGGFGGGGWLSGGNDSNTRYANTAYDYNPNDKTNYNYVYR